MFKYDDVTFAYNVGSRKSCDCMRTVYQSFKPTRPELNMFRPWHGDLVVALASDLQWASGRRDSSTKLDFARSEGLDFVETSTKTGLGCTIADYDPPLQRRSKSVASAMRYKLQPIGSCEPRFLYFRTVRVLHVCRYLPEIQPSLYDPHLVGYTDLAILAHMIVS